MTASSPASATVYEAIDAYIEHQMRLLKIPGVALAIVEGDRMTHLRGFGRARPGGEAPTPQTPFVLGSTTKSITALAVMQLVEQGKIDLDAPVQRYLPWFRVADAGASAAMTVRHLLNQTSGFAMLTGMTLLADLDQSPTAAERQARGLATFKPARAPGAAWEYSNVNFSLLGLIVEAASGEAYPAYVERHIFAPLDMKHSYTSLACAEQDSLAVGHRNWFGQPIPARHLPTPRGSLAAGELISCSEDMAHYLIAMLNGGRYAGAQIVSPEGVAELHRGAADYGALGQAYGQYAMGWFVDDMRGTKLVYHEGNAPEFSTFIALLPEQRQGIVLLFNSHLYGLPMVVAEVGKGAAGLLAGQQPASQAGFARVVPPVARGLALIPALQLASIAFAARSLRRERAASRGRSNRHMLPALMLNLALAALPIMLRAKRMSGYLALFNPDIFWLTRICGGLAGAWAVLTTRILTSQMRPGADSRIEKRLW